MRALLLCAGLGERLRPLTAELAKPTLPVLNEPLAGYALRRLAEAGIREVAVNLHHLGATVRAALGDGERYGVSIRYVEEPEILGTGGAVRNLRDWLGEETCLVANGDTVADLDLTAALKDHRVSGAQATALAEGRDPRPEFSAVWADMRGSLLGFGPEPPVAGARPLHFAGFHILEPEFLKTLPERKAFCLHREGYLPFLRSGGRARVWAGAWAVYDAGTLLRYLALNETLLGEPERAGRLRGRPLPPERSPGCFADAACRIGPGASLHPPVLLEGASVDAGAALGPGVSAAPGSRVGSQSHLTRSVVCRGGSVPRGFSGNLMVVMPRREAAP